MFKHASRQPPALIMCIQVSLVVCFAFCLLSLHWCFPVPKWHPGDNAINESANKNHKQQQPSTIWELILWWIQDAHSGLSFFGSILPSENGSKLAGCVFCCFLHAHRAEKKSRRENSSSLFDGACSFSTLRQCFSCASFHNPGPASIFAEIRWCRWQKAINQQS